MNIKALIISSLLLAPVAVVCGQKMKVRSGDLDFLKSQKKLNIEYDYSNMGVGKFEKEEDYVNEKVAKLNKKEVGSGDKWKKNWIADRNERFEPKFEELFNKNLEKYNLVGGDFDGTEYTLILKTTFTEPGFNVGVVRKNAYTDLEAVFVKTGTTDPVAVVTIENSPGRGGMGYDFDTGYRIQESYAKAGKELGQYLAKKVLK
ncbi:hypothetical protein JMN32_23125 [Fulvivirga sp. 29W222]|uniref:DUF4410 domain-containing protein n=1 Tax=Fulvivirga marina TaxID=2494733 RepID=A0A937KDK2_9BACT|nr:hypothetical protein [Fulvivirga marina]MBL6449221.1 hypothetical protein [Fulvivirga marina]